MKKQRSVRSKAMLCAISLMITQFVFTGCKAERDTTSAPETPSTEAPGAAATPPGEQQPVTQTLTVYCGRNEEMMAPLLARFQEETGIRLQIQYASSPQLAATIVEEGDNTPADVFFSQDVATLAFLGKEGLLRALPPTIMERVPSMFRAEDNLWVGTSGRARTLVYNSTLVSEHELPTSLDGLLDTRWKEQVGWAPENASFQAAIGAMMIERGNDETVRWLRGMQANQARAFSSNMRIVEAVGRGEIQVGLVNHYYLHRLLKEHGDAFPARNHYFRNSKSDSLVNAAGVGILQKSDAPEEALYLVKWLLEQEAQQYFAEQTYEFPLVQGIEASSSLPRLEELALPDISLGALGSLEQTVEALRAANVLP